jgi:MYXO-CTERM domain-containing protein
MLDGDEAEDEYSDTLPNGMVMGALTQVTYGPGVALQQFDPTTNTVTSVEPPPDKGNPYPISYVNLPNGQVMVESEAADGPDWLFTPDGAPQDAWRPTVSSVAFNGGTTYTLTGTQLSGLINGGDEGDDMTMAENYPIVWLEDTSGNVYYCKSFNFSNMMPSNGDTPETCQFTTPAGLASGTYSLYVSAVGVQSKDPFSFTTGASEDAGPASDAGASEASVVSDTGTASDTGHGGVADSASDEVGSTVQPNPGVTGPDSGSVALSSPPAQSGGCGCRTAKSRGLEGGALVGLGGLAMLAVSRRRRRASDVRQAVWRKGSTSRKI